MEIGRRLDPRHIFNVFCVAAFLIYIVVGLQPAGAVNYNIISKLEIPSIGLETDVAKLELEDNGLNTPDEIVGSFSRAENSTLLIGHSSTVFSNLDQVHIGDIFSFNDYDYVVFQREIIPKNDILMADLLKSREEDTIIIMTCAGELFENGDASHRLLLYAERT